MQVRACPIRTRYNSTTPSLESVGRQEKDVGRQMLVRRSLRAFLMVIRIIRILLCFGVVLPVSFANDVFCGKLHVYKQQWFGQHTTAISSQATSDLKQCLELCCNVSGQFVYVHAVFCSRKFFKAKLALSESASSTFIFLRREGEGRSGRGR